MVVDIALICVSISLVLALARVLMGPSWGDRITAFDFLGVNLAVLIVILAIKRELISFFDIALLVSILGFLGTVALTRYLLNGRVME
jgi:multicomponent K+:H+ antiporter subunit F/multicomponent Na+:H+ antiporter subunit F